MQSEVKATFWAQQTEGVNYVRAELPARHLPGKVCLLSPDDLVETEDGHAMPRQEGAAVWMFPGNTTRALLMRDLQQYQGVRVLAEMDDLYLCAPPVHFGIWKEEFDGTDDHSYEIHSRIVSWCDGVIVATPALEREYRELNDNVFVCPNSVDPDDWPENPPHQPGGLLRVGYAGSDSHKKDFELIRPALAWASKQPDVEVVLLGIEMANETFDCRRIPWQEDLAGYRKALGNIDVMLCPLLPDRWNDCKSDLKALEAAMAGAVCIVQDSEPYRPWIPGPAFVARDHRDFLKWVRYAVYHRDEVADMARQAKKYVLSERTIQGNVWRWEEAVEARDRVAA